MASPEYQSCTPCLRRNDTVNASNNCKVCNQNYCKNCLEFHDKIFGVNNHDMINLLTRHETARDAGTTNAACMCMRHPIEPVTLYCFPHNAVFCQMCKTTEHCECIGVEYIAQACHASRKTPELAAKKHNLDTALRRLTELRAWRKHDQERLEKEREVAFASIQDFRRRLDAMLDIMEKDALKQVENQFYSFQSGVVTDLQSCEQMIACIEQLIHLYTNEKTENEAFEMFVFDIKYKEIHDYGRQTADAIEAKMGQEHVEANLSTHLEDDLKRSSLLQSIGDPPGYDQAQALPKFEPTEHRHTEISQIKLVDVTIGDEDGCKIKSACQLSDGWFVLVDYENFCTKLLNENLDLISKTKVGQFPTQVCESGQDEVSVAMEYIASGAIIQLGFAMKGGVRTLVRRSKLKLKHCCLKMHYMDGEYYVSEYSGKLNCYSRTGSHLRTIYKGSTVNDAVIGADFLTFFIADENDGLVILENLGRSGQITKVKYPMDKPTALAADSTGGVFVFDRKTRNVFHVDKTGTIVSPALLAPNLERPKALAICYDGRQNRLIICYIEGNAVEVVTLLR